MSLDKPKMKDPITVDVLKSLHSDTWNRVLKKGEEDIDLPRLEAERHLGHALRLSSERIEDESREAEASGGIAGLVRNEQPGERDKSVGDGTRHLGGD